MSFNNLELTGKFIAARTPKTLDNGKQVNSFFLDITENSDYPNTPEFNLYGDKCALVEGLQKGDEIKVSFNLNGKKYKSKKDGKDGVFTGVQAWKIEKLSEEQKAEVAVAESVAAVSEAGNDDDLPF